MVYDLKISGGLVIDGTGATGRQADIGIVGDRIVAVGELEDTAREEIDARGRVVIPGFVDIHTSGGVDFMKSYGIDEIQASEGLA